MIIKKLYMGFFGKIIDLFNINNLKQYGNLTLEIGFEDGKYDACFFADQAVKKSYIGDDLDSFFEGISDLNNLKKIEITGKNIKKISDAIGKLQNLEELSIRYSNIQEIPESIGKLKNLKELCLINLEKIVKLPESISKLAKLEYLNFNGCRLIRKLPEDIGDIKSLKIIYLNGLVHLEYLPKSLSNSVNLEELHLFSCSLLKNIPENIGFLPKLKYISLINCKGIEDISFLLHKNDSLEIKGIDYIIGKLPVIDYKFKDVIVGKNLSKIDLSKLDICELYKEIQYGSKKIIRQKGLIQLQEKLGDNLKINNGTNIFLNGVSGFGKMQLKEKIEDYGIKIINNIEKADFILLGDKPKIEFTNLDLNKIIFDKDLNVFFEKSGEYYLTNNEDLDVNNLKLLLSSEDEVNIEIAVEMIKNGGLDKNLMIDALVTYQTVKNGKIRKKLENILKLNISTTLANRCTVLYDLRRITDRKKILERAYNFIEGTEIDTGDFITGICQKKLFFHNGIYYDNWDGCHKQISYLKGLKGLSLTHGSIFRPFIYDLNIEKIIIKTKFNNALNKFSKFSKLKELIFEDFKDESIDELKEVKSYVPSGCIVTINGKFLS